MRESLDMQEEDWVALLDIAKQTGSFYSGKPSWRRFVLRIARGEVTCKEREGLRRIRPIEKTREQARAAAEARWRKYRQAKLDESFPGMIEEVIAKTQNEQRQKPGKSAPI